MLDAEHTITLLLADIRSPVAVSGKEIAGFALSAAGAHSHRSLTILVGQIQSEQTIIPIKITI